MSASPAPDLVHRPGSCGRCTQPVVATSCASSPPTTTRSPRSRSWPSACDARPSTCSTTATTSTVVSSQASSSTPQAAFGLPIAGRASWKPGAPDYRRLAVRVARSRPRAVFLGGQLDTGGAAVIRALRDQLGDRVAILVPAAFPPSLLIDQAGSAASGVFVSLTGIAGADQLRREGRRFAQTFSATLAGETLEPSAIYAAQAMEVVLDAIRRSDGTRPSVLQALFETRIRNGLIGTVSFDRNGDIETSPVTILRVEPGARYAPPLPGRGRRSRTGGTRRSPALTPDHRVPRHSPLRRAGRRRSRGSCPRGRTAGRSAVLGGLDWQSGCCNRVCNSPDGREV